MLVGLFLSLLCTSTSDFRIPASSFAPSAPAPSVAIRAKRVILRPGEELIDGTILIERGVIVAVGKDLPVPEGARVIEGAVACAGFVRSEEHTSELQSQSNLVCRLLLETRKVS